MSLNRPRVSIILPAYNVEKYIEATLDSVFAQETQPYEVIIINDGSTDSTLDKVNQYAGRSELTVITTENRGLGPARNEGLQHATGDYVYQADSDDLLDQHLLTTVASTTIEHPGADLILFSGNEFRDDEPSVLKPGDYVRSFSAANLDGNQAVAKLVTAGDIMPVTWLYVSKRSLWMDSQLYFKSIINHTDNEIYLKLLLSAKNVVVLQDVLVYRRIRQMSLTTAPKKAGYTVGLFETTATLVQLYKNSAARPRATKRALRKRAVRTAQRYIRKCRKIGCEANINNMLAYVFTLRSPALLITVLGYISTYKFYKLSTRV